MDWTLEVAVLPVSNIDRAIAFYRDQVGFVLDHDTRTEHMHVAQLTPVGSGCSIVIGDLPAQNEMAPGSMRVCNCALPTPPPPGRSCWIGASKRARSPYSTSDGGTFFGFSDLDGNTWAVQQLTVRASKPLIPVEHRGRFGAD